MSSFRRAVPAGRAGAGSASDGTRGSSFAPAGGSGRREGAAGHTRARPVLAGTRAWINGQAVTSSGQEWLDRMLGSGVALGTVVLVREDESGGHARTFASCFVAQGVLAGHACVVAGTSGRRSLASFVEQLPADRHQPREEEGSEGSMGASGGASGDVVKPCTEADAAPQAGTAGGGPDDGLRIAWQYRKYLPEAGAEADSSGAAPTLRAMPRSKRQPGAHGAAPAGTCSGSNSSVSHVPRAKGLAKYLMHAVWHGVRVVRLHVRWPAQGLGSPVGPQPCHERSGPGVQPSGRRRRGCDGAGWRRRRRGGRCQVLGGAVGASDACCGRCRREQ